MTRSQVDALLFEHVQRPVALGAEAAPVQRDGRARNHGCLAGCADALLLVGRDGVPVDANLTDDPRPDARAAHARGHVFDDDLHQVLARALVHVHGMEDTLVVARAHHDVEARRLGHSQQGLRVALQPDARYVDYRAAAPVAELHDLGDGDRLVGQDVVVRNGLHVPGGVDISRFQLRLPHCKLRRGEVVAGEERLQAPGQFDAHDVRQVALPKIEEEMLVHQGRAQTSGVDRTPNGQDLAG